MKKLNSKYIVVLASLFVSLMLVNIPVQSKEARIIEWVDLAPEGYFDELYEKQKQTLYGGIFDNIGDTFFDEIEDDSEEGQRAFEELQVLLRAAPIVQELNGEHIKLAGFIVPLEFDFDKGTFSEFLLAPYFGACIHVPPPPSNQIVYVKSTKPLKQKWLENAVWVTGVVSTKSFQSEYGSAGYSMDNVKLDVYEDE